MSSRKGREREERCLTTKERPRADLGVSRGSLDHHFFFKAGKCPGHPFLNFLDQPQNASLLSSAEVSFCCREAGEKEKESARGMTGSPTRFLFFSSCYISGFLSIERFCFLFWSILNGVITENQQYTIFIFSLYNVLRGLSRPLFLFSRATWSRWSSQS